MRLGIIKLNSPHYACIWNTLNDYFLDTLFKDTKIFLNQFLQGINFTRKQKFPSIPEQSLKPVNEAHPLHILLFQFTIVLMPPSPQNVPLVLDLTN